MGTLGLTVDDDFKMGLVVGGREVASFVSYSCFNVSILRIFPHEI